MAITLEQAPDNSTIDSDRGAIYVTGALGGQEGDDGREFFRCAQAPRGNLAFPPGNDFFLGYAVSLGENRGKLAQAIGTGVTRADIVHGYTVRRIFVGQGTCQPGDCRA